LNKGRSSLPPLRIDGGFGAKTRVRVMEFQRQNQLLADGIVGPKTWAILDPRPPEKGCGNGDPGNRARILGIQQMLSGVVSSGGITTSREGSSSLVSLGSPMKPFLGSHLDTAQVRGVFGGSMDWSRVFYTNMSGAQNRPFTVATPGPFGFGPVSFQVLNLGSAPDHNTVVHEMAHAWQSQHHSNPVEFMRNCVTCQALAVAQNARAGQINPGLLLQTEQGFPINYPFSAYAYLPSPNFGKYGGEQIAQQVERREGPIVAHMRSVAAGAVDPGNTSSLTNDTATGDKRTDKMHW